jgi:hypothetical protein
MGSLLKQRIYSHASDKLLIEKDCLQKLTANQDEGPVMGVLSEGTRIIWNITGSSKNMHRIRFCAIRPAHLLPQVEYNS